jgi:hypothetical protein
MCWSLSQRGAPSAASNQRYSAMRTTRFHCEKNADDTLEGMQNLCVCMYTYSIHTYVLYSTHTHRHHCVCIRATEYTYIYIYIYTCIYKYKCEYLHTILFLYQLPYTNIHNIHNFGTTNRVWSNAHPCVYTRAKDVNSIHMHTNTYIGTFYFVLLSVAWQQHPPHPAFWRDWQHSGQIFEIWLFPVAWHLRVCLNYVYIYIYIWHCLTFMFVIK